MACRTRRHRRDHLRLRRKAAVGWPLTAKAFHDTALTYWRRRLAASADPNRIFAAVQAVIAQTALRRDVVRKYMPKPSGGFAGRSL